MMRNNKFSIVSTGVLLLLMLAVPSLIQAGPLMKDHAARIRLGVTQFAPARGEKPTIPPGLTVSGYPAGKRGYYILQFPGPIRQDWKEQVTATGAEILHYIPDFAFKVRMTPAEARQVKELESVTWVGLYHPAYKLSQDLKRNGTHFYTVRLEQGGDVGSARAAIAKSGARVLAHKGSILKVAANSAQLEAIARVLDVAWVENFMKWEKHNEWGGGVILGGSTANANGYDGSTQIIAIADTGLGDGTPENAPLDIRSRIDAIDDCHEWPGATTGGTIDWYCAFRVLDNDAEDPSSGHGTHVALSALGEGAPTGEGKGTAPGAHLIFQAVESFVDYYDPHYDPDDPEKADDFICDFVYDLRDGYYLTDIPANIADLFQKAYDLGARIHSNSWGSNAMGAYTVDSKNADAFIWNHRDMTITYSAGNSGIDGNGDGIIDSDSIGSPATAKNIITVGASENERADHYPCDPSLARCDGDNEPLPTYGQAWPGDFPANPIKDDRTGGNAEQMAGFSSRGRTDDARIKPDVVAPGTWVLSGYSDLYQEGYDLSPNWPNVQPENSAWQYDGWGEPYSEFYKYMGGTSMASPLTAGGAAVVRDFYQKTDGHNASAALVKATLINSAHDLRDENNDGVDDNYFPIPNVHEGWGRVDLANATDGSHRYVDDTGGLQTGEVASHQFAVGPGANHFKVTLVWTDYPSSENAYKHLVNNLNLVVRPPVGDSYLGNRFEGGWSITGGLPDKQNNVENVYVLAPAAGTWMVEVEGYNVPYGPQPFALVVDGADFNSPPTASFTADPTTGDAPLLVQFTSTSTDSDGTIVGYDWDFGDGGISDVADPSHTYDTAGEYEVTLTVTDDDLASHTSEPQVITVTDPSNGAPTASFTAVPSSGNAPLEVTFDASASTDPDDDTLTYSWDFGDTTGGTGEITSHIYSDAGTYTAVLTVDDGREGSDTASRIITVNAPPNAMHVEALEVKTRGGRYSLWSMIVTATVKDANNGPVAGATVSYFWSDTPGYIYSNCVTNKKGKCSVLGLQFRGTCLTFTVVDVSHSTLTYDPGQNNVNDISACK